MNFLNRFNISTKVFLGFGIVLAYRAGLTLRNTMLARLYANRFLIQNDDASYRRVIDERDRKCGLILLRAVGEIATSSIPRTSTRS